MRLKTTALIAVLLCTLAVACNSNQRQARDQREAVDKALQQAGYDHIKVDYDRDKKLVTLDGKVRSQELKDRAAQVAQTAAPGQVVANQLSIEPVDEESAAKKIESNTDDAIEKNFKALLIANHMDDACRFHAKNGVLTLEGKVKDMDTRTQLEKLAATVPKVDQVVNKLDVKQGG